MGLRDLASADLMGILEDTRGGFGWSITLTDPAGYSAPVVGFSTDVATAIDPDTGLLISGRTASVALHFSSLRRAGFLTDPRGVSDSKSRPWVVQFADVQGRSYKFKVFRSNPDRALGMTTLELEDYK